MRYAVVYVEAITHLSISDNELRSALAGSLSGLRLQTGDGTVIGQVVHAQVTEGPKPTQEAPAHA
jgi:hypothetical protein